MCAAFDPASRPIATPVLQMRGISKRYPGVRALDEADLDVRAGEVHVILGENGAGKSTLVKILSGAESPDAGAILLDGRQVEIGYPLHARRLGISTIYQELSLVPHLSVAENIFQGLGSENGPYVASATALVLPIVCWPGPGGREVQAIEAATTT